MAVSARDHDATPESKHVPDPVHENPPADRFCDLVLNGGVASGVVYPWALVELARHYRFKSIGGNSVGAMAAAIAAAGEYGRCMGTEDPFEPLRRFPLKLAEVQRDGNTKMFRLFQPSPRVRRLFDLFMAVVHVNNPKHDRKSARVKRGERGLGWMGLIGLVLRKYWMIALPAVVVLVLAVCAALKTQGWYCAALVVALGFVGALLAALITLAVLFYRDLEALAENDYGLCTGRGAGPGEEGLVEWLHKGIQLAAGRGEFDPPLTFADLWAAERFGQPGPAPLPGGLQPLDPGIELQMFASNVTLGRPVRLPLNDPNTRLFYLPKEWERYFPDYLMRELEKASRPYAPASRGDPDPATIPDDKAAELLRCVRELPSGGMPIVVAARLSLCFPILFSCVGVYAIDYESPQGKRRLRRCLLSDGGLCSNFPIHLFDAAHPEWPTFGFLLDSRLRPYANEAVWRPKKHLEGRADNWMRFVPGAEYGKKRRSLLSRLLGFTGGMVVTMKDWNDRMTGRLPQVRNRIVRLALRDGEGQLNLDMPPETILRMAHEYGTKAGKKLAKAFVPRAGRARPAWREHLYVRSMIELRSLRQHVRDYASAVGSRGSTMPLRELLEEATRRPPLRSDADRPDPTASRLTAAQRDALVRAVKAVEALEAELAACERDFGPYVPVIEPVLHLRPPL